jgi:hypothetical protein
MAGAAVASANTAAATSSAYSAGVAAGSAATPAYAMGAIYGTVPAGCITPSVRGTTYYLCGNTWFQPSYGANGVYYTVVPAPWGCPHVLMNLPTDSGRWRWMNWAKPVEETLFGIRASIVRARQGADIIVPNAQLVTDKVTNRTLNDKLRRLELPVGVNYGASPKKVIAILEAVARTTARVLANPPPRALFMSYGGSSINFELRVWTDETMSWRQVRSNLAVAVYDAILEAGIAFPFPQRKVHLVKDLDSPEK